MGGKPHTLGPRRASLALIWARLHMDLIGWEIIICWGKNEGQSSKRSRRVCKERQGETPSFTNFLLLWPAEKQLGTMKCCTAAFCSYFSLFMSLCLYFLFRPLSHSQPRINISLSFHKTLKETYLALVTSRVSVKRKRCLSWICKPVFSCVWAWPRNRRPGHSARKAWTRGQVSGLTGVKQLSLGGQNRDNADARNDLHYWSPKEKFVVWSMWKHALKQQVWKHSWTEFLFASLNSYCKIATELLNSSQKLPSDKNKKRVKKHCELETPKKWAKQL